MEEIKILIYALVSFLSQEQIPIVAKSAEMEINIQTKQIILHQYDLQSVEQYRELAKAGLDSLMRISSLNADLAPISMTSKHIYEENGKLNAALYLQFKDLRDLRKISIYADADGNLSYPYMEQYEYGLEGGRIDGRYVRFDAGSTIKFSMERSEDPGQKTYSMAEDWKALEENKFVDVSNEFSKKDFQKVRKFIFKNGDRRTYRNFDNNNPHYSFEAFDVYLGTGTQAHALKANKIKNKNYTELVIHDEQYYTVYLISDDKRNKRQFNLEADRVYWHDHQYSKDAKLKEYLAKILEEINR